MSEHGRDPLYCARRGALKACQLLKAMAEKGLFRGALGAADVADSLYSRARQAPGLAATWGMGAFLVFYASKAVDLAEDCPGLLDYLVGGGSQGLCRRNKYPNSTALGYAVYLAALLGAHRCLYGEPQETGEFVRDVDGLIRLYLGGSGGGGPAGSSLALVENLSRFLLLYVEPLAAKLRENNAENNGRSLEDVISEECPAGDP